MSKKTILVCALAVVALLAFNYQGNVAQSKPGDDSVSIGVISVRRIFDESKRRTNFEERITTEQEQAIAEFEKGKADIIADRAGLKTLKSGSSEYMAQMKMMMGKQAKLTADQKFFEQKLTLMQLDWMESTYNEIIRLAGEIAKERGLDLVLENSKVDLSSFPGEILPIGILVRTVIHNDGCIDITDEVMAKLDAAN